MGPLTYWPSTREAGEVLAILAPGQGSQRSGVLQPWLTDDTLATLQRYSKAAGIDLVAAGTTMSDAEITDTAIAQPLIVAASLDVRYPAARAPDATRSSPDTASVSSPPPRSPAS